MTGGTEPGPLARELQRLWLAAGRPTTREVVRKAQPHNLSTYTVHAMTKGRRVALWPTVETLTLALGGDLDRVRALWLAENGADVTDIEAINNLARALDNLADAIRAHNEESQ